MARGWLRGLAVTVAVTVLASCSQGEEDAKAGPARGIVVDLGGRLAVLDSLDAEPRIVGEREEDTEKFDGYHLTGPRRLAEGGRIVGIRQGTAVAVSAEDPMRAVLVAPAADWFPSSDGKRLWTVTEQPTDVACQGQQLPKTVRARYTAADHEPSGRPARRTLTLPCGYRPVAESIEGLVAEQTTADTPTEGTVAVARTRVVLMDRAGTAAARTVTESGTALGAAGKHILWRGDGCTQAACTQVYDTLRHASGPVPSCPSGTPVGRGALDPTGRWYATVLRADDGDRVAVLDLDRNGCKDVGRFAGLPEGDKDLGDGLTVSWSGAELLLLDATGGELHGMDARTGRTEHRNRRLELGDGAQIWGALPG